MFLFGNKKKENKKYRMTKKTFELMLYDTVNQKTVKKKLRQIQSLIDIPEHGVVKGDLGGFIENEYNLSHEGLCWLKSGHAFGNTSIRGNILIIESTIENSLVYSTEQFEKNVIYKSSIQDSTVLDCTLIESECHTSRLQEGCMIKTSTIEHSSLSSWIQIEVSTLQRVKASGQSTDSKTSSIVIENTVLSAFENKKNKSLDDFIFFIENKKDVLKLKFVHIDMKEDTSEPAVVFQTDGTIERFEALDSKFIEMYHVVSVKDVTLEKGDLKINSWDESKTTLEGISKEHPLVLREGDFRFDECELKGQVLISGSIYATEVQMSGFSKIYHTGQASLYLKKSSLSDASILSVDNGSFHSIHLTGDDQLTL